MNRAKFFLVVVVCLSMIVALDFFWMHDGNSPDHDDNYRLIDISPPYLSILSLGHESLAADCLWLDLVFRLGTESKTGTDAHFLKTYIDSITRLSPAFGGVYEFTGALVPRLTGDVDYSNRILEMGRVHVSKRSERYWYIPFYLGINAYFWSNDSSRAGRFIEEASTFEAAPAYFPRLAATLYAKGGDTHAGLEAVERFLKVYDDPYILSLLRKKKRALKGQVEKETSQYLLRLMFNKNESTLLEAMGLF
ncbi:hypothetical protein [Desulfoluna butyratoxydans]|uniref:Tetratricopeptide-like helical domain n=1 Tax=Desulfoluna butyratoxydans TaxID=231438 RepID=A0A4U8YTT3_9BACT|nr:hypothetical protein [Desulfoluna butyratoxydans]VFQ47284.1 hypothetical protein MSL71_49790 [Desulfoluna butyratoxydans]